MIARKDFATWLQTRPVAALALLETLSLRLRRTDEALADLTFLDLPHRLAKQLVRMSSADSEGRPPPVKVTQGELASMLRRAGIA